MPTSRFMITLLVSGGPRVATSGASVAPGGASIGGPSVQDALNAFRVFDKDGSIKSTLKQVGEASGEADKKDEHDDSEKDFVDEDEDERDHDFIDHDSFDYDLDTFEEDSLIENTMGEHQASALFPDFTMDLYSNNCLAMASRGEWCNKEKELAVSFLGICKVGHDDGKAFSRAPLLFQKNRIRDIFDENQIMEDETDMENVVLHDDSHANDYTGIDHKVLGIRSHEDHDFGHHDDRDFDYHGEDGHDDYHDSDGKDWHNDYGGHEDYHNHGMDRVGHEDSGDTHQDSHDGGHEDSGDTHQDSHDGGHEVSHDIHQDSHDAHHDTGDHHDSDHHAIAADHHGTSLLDSKSGQGNDKNLKKEISHFLAGSKEIQLQEDKKSEQGATEDDLRMPSYLLKAFSVYRQFRNEHTTAAFAYLEQYKHNDCDKVLARFEGGGDQNGHSPPLEVDGHYKKGRSLDKQKEVKALVKKEEKEIAGVGNELFPGKLNPEQEKCVSLLSSLKEDYRLFQREIALVYGNTCVLNKGHWNNGHPSGKELHSYRKSENQIRKHEKEIHSLRAARGQAESFLESSEKRGSSQLGKKKSSCPHWECGNRRRGTWEFWIDMPKVYNKAMQYKASKDVNFKLAENDTFSVIAEKAAKAGNAMLMKEGTEDLKKGMTFAEQRLKKDVEDKLEIYQNKTNATHFRDNEIGKWIEKFMKTHYNPETSGNFIDVEASKEQAKEVDSDVNDLINEQNSKIEKNLKEIGFEHMPENSKEAVKITSVDAKLQKALQDLGYVTEADKENMSDFEELKSREQEPLRESLKTQNSDLQNTTQRFNPLKREAASQMGQVSDDKGAKFHEFDQGAGEDDITRSKEIAELGKKRREDYNLIKKNGDDGETLDSNEKYMADSRESYYTLKTKQDLLESAYDFSRQDFGLLVRPEANRNHKELNDLQRGLNATQIKKARISENEEEHLTNAKSKIGTDMDRLEQKEAKADGDLDDERKKVEGGLKADLKKKTERIKAKLKKTEDRVREKLKTKLVERMEAKRTRAKENYDRLVAGWVQDKQAEKKRYTDREVAMENNWQDGFRSKRDDLDAWDQRNFNKSQSSWNTRYRIEAAADKQLNKELQDRIALPTKTLQEKFAERRGEVQKTQNEVLVANNHLESVEKHADLSSVQTTRQISALQDAFLKRIESNNKQNEQKMKEINEKRKLTEAKRNQLLAGLADASAREQALSVAAEDEAEEARKKRLADLEIVRQDKAALITAMSAYRGAEAQVYEEEAELKAVMNKSKSQHARLTEAKEELRKEAKERERWDKKTVASLEDQESKVRQRREKLKARIENEKAELEAKFSQGRNKLTSLIGETSQQEAYLRQQLANASESEKAYWQLKVDEIAAERRKHEQALKDHEDDYLREKAEMKERHTKVLKALHQTAIALDEDRIKAQAVDERYAKWQVSVEEKMKREARELEGDWLNEELSNKEMRKSAADMKARMENTMKKLAEQKNNINKLVKKMTKSEENVVDLSVDNIKTINKLTEETYEKEKAIYLKNMDEFSKKNEVIMQEMREERRKQRAKEVEASQELEEKLKKAQEGLSKDQIALFKIAAEQKANGEQQLRDFKNSEQTAEHFLQNTLVRVMSDLSKKVTAQSTASDAEKQATVEEMKNYYTMWSQNLMRLQIRERTLTQKEKALMQALEQKLAGIRLEIQKGIVANGKYFEDMQHHVNIVQQEEERLKAFYKNSLAEAGGMGAQEKIDSLKAKLEALNLRKNNEQEKQHLIAVFNKVMEKKREAIEEMEKQTVWYLSNSQKTAYNNAQSAIQDTRDHLSADHRNILELRSGINSRLDEIAAEREALVRRLNSASSAERLEIRRSIKQLTEEEEQHLEVDAGLKKTLADIEVEHAQIKRHEARINAISQQIVIDQREAKIQERKLSELKDFEVEGKARVIELQSKAARDENRLKEIEAERLAHQAEFAEDVAAYESQKHLVRGERKNVEDLKAQLTGLRLRAANMAEKNDADRKKLQDDINAKKEELEDAKKRLKPLKCLEDRYEIYHNKVKAFDAEEFRIKKDMKADEEEIKAINKKIRNLATEVMDSENTLMTLKRKTLKDTHIMMNIVRLVNNEANQLSKVKRQFLRVQKSYNIRRRNLDRRIKLKSQALAEDLSTLQTELGMVTQQWNRELAHEKTLVGRKHSPQVELNRMHFITSFLELSGRLSTNRAGEQELNKILKRHSSDENFRQYADKVHGKAEACRQKADDLAFDATAADRKGNKKDFYNAAALIPVAESINSPQVYGLSDESSQMKSRQPSELQLAIKNATGVTDADRCLTESLIDSVHMPQTQGLPMNFVRTHNHIAEALSILQLTDQIHEKRGFKPFKMTAQSIMDRLDQNKGFASDEFDPEAFHAFLEGPAPSDHSLLDGVHREPLEESDREDLSSDRDSKAKSSIAADSQVLKQSLIEREKKSHDFLVEHSAVNVPAKEEDAVTRARKEDFITPTKDTTAPGFPVQKSEKKTESNVKQTVEKNTKHSVIVDAKGQSIVDQAVAGAVEFQHGLVEQTEGRYLRRDTKSKGA